MYRHGPASAFVHLAQRCARQCSQRSDSVVAHSEHVTAQKEPRMAATLVTVGRKAGRLTADQTLCMSGRAGSFASQELVAEAEHAPRHPIDKVSKQTGKELWGRT